MAEPCSMAEPYSSFLENRESMLMVGREERFSVPEYSAVPSTS